MITNFEAITQPLNSDELALIPVLVANFKKHGPANPITSPRIVAGMQAYLQRKGSPIRFTDARLRKCCNYIRTKALIPLMASSKGYYVSYNTDHIREQVMSLRERAGAIIASAQGLSTFLKAKQQTIQL